MSKIPHGGDARHHYLYGYAACRRAETLSPQDPSDKVWHFGGSHGASRRSRLRGRSRVIRYAKKAYVRK